jgi:transposase
MSDGENKPVARVKQVDRNQLKLKVVNIEEVIGRSHAARAIWEFVGRQNLEEFYRGIKAVEGTAGREAWDPQMMISIWVYAYSRGISSAREISRLCRYDPAFVWLTGDMEINHHSLSDFRTEQGEALKQLFVEVLGAMSSAGLIMVTRVMQDGTKVEASASSRSFHREATIRKHLEMAEEQVRRMEELSDKEMGKKAKERKAVSAKEKKQRMEQALAELEKVRSAKRTAEEKKEARASTSDPDARVMKHANGGYEPSYNVQITTDSENKAIVGMSVSQSGNDMQELQGAVRQVEENTGKKPKQVVVDGGYISTENIVGMEKEGIELYGPLVDRETKSANVSSRLKRVYGIDEAFLASSFTYNEQTNSLICPAGKTLSYLRSYVDGQQKFDSYRARLSDCQECPLKMNCCPKNKTQGRGVTRSQILPEVARFNDQMKTEQAKAIYKLRGEVAEFPNLWMKEKLELRRFRLRGIAKVGIEALWRGLTYNLQLFIRLTSKRSVQVLM